MTDLRYALRNLRQSPGFTAIAVLSLALGIGANSCIFSIVNGLMLKSLPVKDPNGLVLITSGKNSLTNLGWEFLRDHQDFLSTAAVWGNATFDTGHGADVHRIVGYWVSGDYFRTLGVQPAAGRLIAATDDRRGCPGIAVLGYNYWQQHYNGDPAVVGKSISLNGFPFEVVGVAGEGFYGMEVGRSVDVNVPICAEPIVRGKVSALDHRSTFWLRVLARPKPSITRDQLAARLAVISPQLFAATVPEYWNPADRATFLKRRLTAAPGGSGVSYLRTKYETSLRMLMVVVGVVLLIACTNVANLLLARGSARQREMAVRLAIGAPRARLVRQLLTESVLLAVIGAACGTLLSVWGSRVLVDMLSSSVLTVRLDVSPDVRVLGGTILLALLTGVIFGIAPAWRSTSIAPNAALKERARGITQPAGKLSLNRILVVAQLGLSLLLLIGAGLFVRTFRNLLTLDPGFNRNQVLIADLNLHKAGIPKPELRPVYEDLRGRLSALPGVQSVSYSGVTPISGSSMSNDDIKTDYFTAASRGDATIYINFVSAEYFRTLQTPILAGRDVGPQDTPTTLGVAVINETMARKFFPGANPIGKVFRQPMPPPDDIVQVIGIVKDAKYTNLRDEVPPTAYFAASQSAGSEFKTYEIRFAGTAEAMFPQIKKAIGSVNSNITVESKLLSTQIDDSLIQERLVATLSGGFGILALSLATIGLYGVMAYMVARRRGEIGIRMALGAQRSSVIALILREVALLVAAGSVAGAAAALATTQLVQKMLYGVKPADALTISAAITILATVATLAGYLPAQKAATTDPLTSLREE